MTIRLLLLLLAVCAAPNLGFAQAQPAPYAGQQSRAIKALSDDDIAALLKGEGMGMAKAAELNGYPGPAHVLALAAQLKLSDAQRQQVQLVFDRMSANAKSLGAELVDRERMLDRRFAAGEISADRLAQETAAIALLQGKLRSVHLGAHLETRPILTSEQMTAYQRLRGYASPGGRTHHHG